MIALVLDKYKRVKGTISNKGTYPFVLKSHFENLDNSAISVEFEVPMDNYMSQHITDYGHVAFERNGILHMFKNLIVEENRARRTKNVMAVGVAVELSKKFVEPFSNEKRTAKQHAEFFLTNTPWRVGEFYYNGVKTMSSDKQISVLEAVQRIRTTFGVDILFRVEEKDGEITGYYMDILERRGVVYPKRFEVGKNIEGIRRKIDSSELVTALYGYGERDESENADEPLTFANVEWKKSLGAPVDKPLGQTWVGDPEALSKYSDDGTHIFGVHESTVKGDPADLLKYTWQVLQNKNKPKITYEVDISLLGNVEVGDTLNIADFTNKDDVLLLEARVHEKDVIYLPNGQQRGKVTLKNFKEIEYEKPDYIQIINKRLKLFATKLDMQMAVDEAKQAMLLEAQNQIGLAELEAKSYADGIVSAEEERAILDAQNKLDESKRYSDTKKQEAINAANNYADQQIMVVGEEITDVENQINSTKTYIDGAFKDGVINEAETIAIEKYLNTLNAEKADIENRYNQIYNDPLLSGDVKTNLNVKNNAYNIAHTNLINSINTAIADGQTTDAEKTDVNTKFDAYKIAIGELSDAFEKSVNYIAQSKANKAEINAQLYTDAVRDGLNQAIEDVNLSVNNLDAYIDGAFKDGIVSNAEATAIEKYLNTVRLEKTDLDGRYAEIYNNQDLEDSTIKMNLQTKKTTYETSYNNLINSINAAIADGEATITEKQDVDSKFSDYRNSLSNLTIVLEQALTSISQTKVDKVEVGGTNLLRYTDFKDPSKFVGWGNRTSITQYFLEDWSVFRISSQTTGSVGLVTSKFSMLQDDWMVVSFLAKPDDQELILNYNYILSPKMGNHYFGTIDFKFYKPHKNGFYQVGIVFKAPYTTDDAQLLLGFNATSVGQGYDMTQLKLETGNKRTAHSLNPLDVEDSAVAVSKDYTNVKDSEIRQGLQTGAVAVSQKTIMDEIQAGKLDIDLAVQGGVPPESGQYVEGLAGEFIIYGRNETLQKWQKADYVAFKHFKRYLTIELFGAWEFNVANQTNKYQGKCEYFLSTTEYLVDMIPGTRGEFTVRTSFDTPAEQKRVLTIDLGTPDKSMKKIYILFRISNGGNWDQVFGYTAHFRIGMRFQHD